MSFMNIFSKTQLIDMYFKVRNANLSKGRGGREGGGGGGGLGDLRH